MSKPQRRRAVVLDRLPALACRHRDCALWKAAGCWHATLCMDYQPPKKKRLNAPQRRRKAIALAMPAPTPQTTCR